MCAGYACTSYLDFDFDSPSPVKPTLRTAGATPHRGGCQCILTDLQPNRTHIVRMFGPCALIGCSIQWTSGPGWPLTCAVKDGMVLPRWLPLRNVSVDSYAVSAYNDRAGTWQGVCNTNKTLTECRVAATECPQARCQLRVSAVVGITRHYSDHCTVLLHDTGQLYLGTNSNGRLF